MRSLAKLLIFVLVVQLYALDISAQPRVSETSTLAKVLHNEQLVSRQKRDIPIVRIAAPGENLGLKPRARYFIQAGLHGNEQLTTTFALWLIKRLRAGISPLNKLNAGEAAFDILPAVNPDGLKKQTRFNSNFVNLNRNFSFLWGLSRENPGKQSFSEPETKAIRELFAATSYTAAADIHGYVNWIVLPTAPKANAPKGMAEKYRQWSDIVNRHMTKIEPSYQLKTAGSLGDGGAFEDWAFWDANVPALCLEMISAFQFDLVEDEHGKTQKIDFFERYEKFLYDVFAAYSDAPEVAIK